MIILDQYENRDIPVPAIVMAIIEHETRGNPNKCFNELNGSSSWGLMQINHPHSRCEDGLFKKELEPKKNIYLGIKLLTQQSKYHREKCHTGHDPLMHYAGKGKAAMNFAKDIRILAANIEDDFLD